MTSRVFSSHYTVNSRYLNVDIHPQLFISQCKFSVFSAGDKTTRAVDYTNLYHKMQEISLQYLLTITQP